MGNNTLFRIGTDSGWCTRTSFIGCPFTSTEADVIRKNDIMSIQDIRDILTSCINRLPKQTSQLLWALSTIKIGAYGGSLNDFGGIIKCHTEGVDRIIIKYNQGRMLELRVKRKGKNDDQKDLVIVEVR